MSWRWAKIPKIQKSNRLKDYDYSQNGAYFVTICTKNREPLLSQIVGGGFHAAPQIELSRIGLEIDNAIHFYSHKYENIFIDKYVIMPNHIHLIMMINSGTFLGGHGNPPLQNTAKSSDKPLSEDLPLHSIIGQLKSFTTKQFNLLNNTQYHILWQRSYHDHIIRHEAEYQQIWRYIDENPLKWQQDCYYC